MKRTLLSMAVGLLVGFVARGASVRVYQQTELDGSVAQISDTIVETGVSCLSVNAPTIKDAIFIGWSISDGNQIETRDVLGRVNEVAPFVVYDTATITAHYLSACQDLDEDEVLDGVEMYWYGTLDLNGKSDTDNDGYSMSVELASGTNPLIKDYSINGGITSSVGKKILYNPENLGPCIIRSDPEGVLFPTTTNYLNIGQTIALPEPDHKISEFAYWMVNGVRQKDGLGRSVDTVVITMPNHTVECVARCEADSFRREQLYWYGTADVAADSDTDKDGFTFAQEIAAGTNPLLYDYTIEGGVLKSESSVTIYNAKLQSPYVVRSDPEGELVATTTNYVIIGTTATLPAVSGANFAYWMIDGVAQRDELGRALESVSFRMPNHTADCVALSIADSAERAKLYWYGRTDVSMDDDTDGDGFSFAQEIAAGTNPHLVDYTLEGGVLSSVSEIRELDLQKYEQVMGTLVDEKFTELFTSPLAGNGAASRTFAGGAQIWPVVGDVNGDGLWDFIVVSATTTNVFVNVGSKGNPQFANCGSEVVVPATVDLQVNSVAKLAEMTLDVEPVGALSATTNGATMLVSDVDGRIWYYERRDEDVASTWVLRHKVWGGSYDGFAQGLMLAAVDWEDDGDLDCFCGTAEGKLMLLRDPKVGRPTGLTAAAGVDNVLLTWEPNGGSRICGYKVYRDKAKIKSEGEEWRVVSSPSLPSWRDFPEVIADYDYKVTALSRFYTAGNSAPTESESEATEPVRAELGKVSFRWSDAAGFVGDEIVVDLGVQNSLNLAGEGLSLAINYDASVLQPLRVVPSGLTTNVTFTQTAASGVWNVTATGGEIAAGGGTFFSFVFKGLAETNATPVSLSSVTMKSVGGATVPAILPTADALVKVEEFIEPEPAHARVMMTESVQVTAGESFTVVVSVTGEDIDVSTLSFDYIFDGALLSRNGNTFTATDVKSEAMTSITLTNVVVKSTDGAAAVVDSAGMCSVAITPKSGGESGHLANLTLGEVKGKTGETVEMPVGIKGAFKETTVDVSTWRFSVNYDKRLLKPVGIAATDGSYAWSAKEGVMTIVGTSGTLSVGTLLSDWKYPLALRFEVLTQYAKHQTTVDFESVEMKATNGDKILTPVRESGSVYVEFARPKEDPTVVVPYSRGDLNGDGRLTKEDKQLLAELMNGKGGKSKKPTAEQLRAGDYNGNGRLDQDDYQLLKDDFKSRGIK